MSVAPHAGDESVGEPIDGDDAEAQPMNRAERRAKHKGKEQPAPAAKIVPGRTNNTHGPRQYSHRRSG
jgi:hypothetical protein